MKSQPIHPGEILLEEYLLALQIKPFTEKESEEAFSPDPEWEAIEASMARLPISIPHEKQIGTRIEKKRLAVDILAEKPNTLS